MRAKPSARRTWFPVGGTVARLRPPPFPHPDPPPGQGIHRRSSHPQPSSGYHSSSGRRRRPSPCLPARLCINRPRAYQHAASSSVNTPATCAADNSHGMTHHEIGTYALASQHREQRHAFDREQRGLSELSRVREDRRRCPKQLAQRQSPTMVINRRNTESERPANSGNRRYSSGPSRCAAESGRETPPRSCPPIWPAYRHPRLTAFPASARPASRSDDRRHRHRRCSRTPTAAPTCSPHQPDSAARRLQAGR